MSKRYKVEVTEEHSELLQRLSGHEAERSVNMALDLFRFAVNKLAGCENDTMRLVFVDINTEANEGHQIAHLDMRKQHGKVIKDE